MYVCKYVYRLVSKYYYRMAHSSWWLLGGVGHLVLKGKWGLFDPIIWGGWEGREGTKEEYHSSIIISSISISQVVVLVVVVVVVKFFIL